MAARWRGPPVTDRLALVVSGLVGQAIGGVVGSRTANVVPGPV
jgi:hypothetical protein